MTHIEYYPSDGKPVKYRLVIASIPNKSLAVCALNHLHVFTIVKDLGAGLLSRDEYDDLVSDGFIEGSDYFKPSKGSWCIAMPEEAFKFNQTIDTIRIGYNDYKDGWYDCIKKYKSMIKEL
jgi:hypothetical protein